MFRLLVQEVEDGTAAKPVAEKWSVLQQTSRTGRSRPCRWKS